jgi:hypothetical protein
MKPYIVESCTLYDYDGEEIPVRGLRTKEGGALICRRPLQFVEDELISMFNDMLPHRLITNIKLNIRPL